MPGTQPISTVPENHTGVPRVLVVDDDPGVLLIMSETLRGAGFMVEEASDGQEAVSVCSTFQPDLIMMDIEMPEMDGITALSALRRDPRFAQLPIVMVTGLDDESSIDRAFEAGATDFMLKPVNWPLFQRRVEILLNKEEEALAADASKHRLELLDRAAPDTMIIVKRNGEIIEELGHQKTDPEHRSLEDLWSPEIAGAMKQRVRRVLQNCQETTLDFSERKQGMTKDYQARFRAEGRDRVLIIVQDMGLTKGTKDAVYELAYFDTITGLPNRHMLEKTAEEQIIDARLHEHNLTFLYLLFEDLTEVGAAESELLHFASEHLTKTLANSSVPDNDNLLLAFLGDGRFALLLSESDIQAVAETVVRQINNAFTVPIQGPGKDMVLTPIAGYAYFPKDGSDVTSLMQAAEAAVQDARFSGSSLRAYSESSGPTIIDRMDMGHELKSAIHRGELEVFYQPRFELSSGDIVGAEALLRWQHPIRGSVPPIQLIQTAKATGLMVDLGNWVLDSVTSQMTEWAESLGPLNIAINLSRNEFARQEFLARIRDKIETGLIDPKNLAFELTEAALTGDKALETLHALKGLGVSMILDGFGTGHTSLAQLKTLPISGLKIERSFVTSLPHNQEDAAICEVIINMAHILGLKAVAQGIETPEQLAFMQNHDCEEGQGFLLGDALPAHEFANLFAKK